MIRKGKGMYQQPQQLLDALMPFAAMGALLDAYEGDHREVVHVWVGGTRCAITLSELAQARHAYESNGGQVGA